MARKRKKPEPISEPSQQAAESLVPKFEIGVKGDEFDLKYTRAAAEKTAGADSLLRSLSKESRAAEFNLINFAVLALLILLAALSFAFLSREDTPPKFKASALFSGEYTARLTEYYNGSLPFGDGLRAIGARLGFCEKADKTPEPEPDDSGNNVVEPPVTVSTEPAVTTAPPTETDAPTSAPSVETTEMTEPDTYRMYAGDTLNVCLEPNAGSMIMGYFDINEEVNVIEVRDDGFAAIWYNGMVAYVNAANLSEKKVRITVATTEEEIIVTEEETEETSPEETEPVDSETETEAEVTTTRPNLAIMDPAVSRYLEMSRKAAEESRAAATQTEETAETEVPEGGEE